MNIVIGSGTHTTISWVGFLGNCRELSETGGNFTVSAGVRLRVIVSAANQCHYQSICQLWRPENNLAIVSSPEKDRNYRLADRVGFSLSRDSQAKSSFFNPLPVRGSLLLPAACECVDIEEIRETETNCIRKRKDKVALLLISVVVFAHQLWVFPDP